MITSNETSNIAKALVKAQKAITFASKDALNPHLKSKYADLPSVIDAVKVALNESGISLETRFNWVVRSEELKDNGEDMAIEEILKEVEELYGLENDYALTVGDSEKFDEFTLIVCPAPTYIDLIK